MKTISDFAHQQGRGPVMAYVIDEATFNDKVVVHTLQLDTIHIPREDYLKHTFTTADPANDERVNLLCAVIDAV